MKNRSELKPRDSCHGHNKQSIVTWLSISFLFGVITIIGFGFFEYQTRLNLASLMLALCGGCYVNGPFGKLESIGGLFFYLCAYLGLYNPFWIGLGWLVHGIVDAFHHYADYPMVHWLWFSSIGCAVMDPVLAAYFFFGAPSQILPF